MGDTTTVVASFFGCLTSRKPKPHMCSDATCTYASLQYQHATASALRARPYVGVAPGEYIHLTLANHTVGAQVPERIDEILLHKIPQETRVDAAFKRHMKAGRQLGADVMTHRDIRVINLETQLLAELEPINLVAWAEAIITKLGHTHDKIGPTELHTRMDTMAMDGQAHKPTNDKSKTTETNTESTHEAQKTKAHKKTPQKTQPE